MVGLLYSIYIRHGSGICHIKPLPKFSTENYFSPGDLILGVLLPLHGNSGEALCSPNIRQLRHIQRIEAIDFAIEEINRNDTLLPNVKLGYSILDECGNRWVSAGKALQFIQDTSACTKSANETLPMVDAVAVIGTGYSSTTVPVADILSIFRLPLISFFATTEQLDDMKYSYFFRTVPSDVQQVSSMRVSITIYV